MELKKILISLFLTFFVIFLSYLTSKSIVQIAKIEKNIDSKTNENINISNIIFEEKNESKNIINIDNESFENKTEKEIFIEKIEKNKDISYENNKTKIVNYTKFEEAYIYDICYTKEILSIEGKNFVCLNEIPKNIRIFVEDNNLKIIYNDILIREEKLSDKILLGYAYAKDFYGVEGEIEKFYTNSTIAYIEDFGLGNIEYFGYKIVYAYFPIYLNSIYIKNETIHIFVKTSMKDYLISSINIDKK